MDETNLIQTICNWIILIGGATGAVVAILNFIGKPINFFKKRNKELVKITIDEVLPTYLEDFRKQEQEQLQEIIELNKQQSEVLAKQEKSIQNLIESEKDRLRYDIMDIYQTYKKERSFPIYIKEKLDETHKNYKKFFGNSYIDKYYNRMQKWKTIENEEEI